MKQEQFVENAVQQMAKQAEQAFGLVKLYRSQVEKITDIWMDQSVEALKQSQKMAKDWWNVASQMSDDFTTACQANAKEAWKVVSREGLKAGQA